jgi:hypothetical protein
MIEGAILQPTVSMPSRGHYKARGIPRLTRSSKAREASSAALDHKITSKNLVDEPDDASESPSPQPKSTSSPESRKRGQHQAPAGAATARSGKKTLPNPIHGPNKKASASRKKQKTVKEALCITAELRQKGAKIREVLNRLHSITPIPLSHASPFQLLIAVMLSAQVSSCCQHSRISTYPATSLQM